MRRPSRVPAPALVLLCTACVVESTRPPLVSGDGIVVDPVTQQVSVDANRVATIDGDCAAGTVLQRGLDGWSCVAPEELEPDRIPNVETCAVDQVVLRTADGWTCGARTDAATSPVVAACAPGHFVRRAADGWECTPAYDPQRVPELDTCPAGLFVRRTGTGWECADPVDPAVTPVLAACPSGSYVAMSDDGWTCSVPVDTTRTPVVSGACPAGLFVQRTLTGWGCAAPLDPAKTPVVESCPAGQFVTRTSGGWACAAAYDPSVVPNVVGCPSGQFVQRAGQAWTCAAAFDPVQVPVVATCPAGQFVRKTAVGWECALPPVDAAATPVVSACAPGQLVSRTVAGWACVDAPPDVTKTPIVESCAAGNWVRKTDNGWACMPLQGSLVGDVTGNVTGNVTGDVTGNVTGNVSGTAENVRGVVPVARGGTGTSNIGNGHLVAGGSTTLVGLPPTAGMLLAADAGAWAPRFPFDLGLARRTSAAMTFYVRTDGHDANCNGTADVAAPGTNRACAVATLQRAIDLVPEFVDNPVEIRIAAGTYVASGAIATVSKALRPGAGLTIRGVGAVVLDAADAASGFVAAGLGGPLTLVNLVLEEATGVGLLVRDTQVIVDGVTVRDHASHGIQVDDGGQVDFSGPLTVSGNGGVGIQVESGSFAQGSGGVTVTGNASVGVNVRTGSAFWAGQPAGGSPPPSATVSNNGSYGILAANGLAGVVGKLVMAGNAASPMRADGFGRFSLSGECDVRSDLVNGAGIIDLIDHGIAVVSAAASKTMLFKCGAGGATLASSVGWRAVRDGTFLTGGTGTITVDGCATGVVLDTNAVFIGDAAGTRTLSNGTKSAVVARLSVYASSSFTDAQVADCTGGSQCN